MPSQLTLPHSEKVLAHAEQQLLARGDTSSAELLGLYKKFLKIEDHRIRLKHHSGGGGREICSQRASLVDIVLRHLLDTALDAPVTGNGKAAKLPKLALVAIGGYGRGELNPYSDVDIMFLHPNSVKNLGGRYEETIQQILYTLWDVGFKVGHSTRSIAEAVKQANGDMLSKTSLLEARLVTGDAELFHEFQAEYLKKCVEGQEDAYILERVQNQADRHEKYGRTVYMQEPNIKNGCGGLRDYQNLLWASFFKVRTRSTAGLVERKLLNESERRALDRAYDFLLRVRTELHYLNKRAADVIILSQQLQLANKLDYPQKNILRRTEAFMRDYYQHARQIYYTTELLFERLSLGDMAAATEKRASALFGFLGKAKPVDRFDGFFSTEGRLYAETTSSFSQEPARLMRVFQHMQQRQLHISPELQQLIRRRLHLVDRTFQYSKAARETFTAILSRKGQVGSVLRAMHEVDFLGRYIPEFGQLTCLVQHEFFHRYTADEHTLVCIEKLDSLIDTQDPKLLGYKELFRKLDDPFVLYLALLLHDTGKASNAHHHAEASALYAQKVAARLQINPEMRKTLIFLVDHHITLSSLAQKRNLDDPTTIAEFAGLVKTQSNLDALMLLTLADGQGTGDQNWSDWKESLVWQLYRSTSSYLADSEAFYKRRQTERETLHASVRGKMRPDYQDEVDAHFERMPDRYFQAYSMTEIIEHIRLFRSFLRHYRKTPLLPALRWAPQPNKGHTEFWFCGWDRPALLARIAGSLSVSQFNILSADVFTRSDNLVLDVFRVCNTSFEAITDERETAPVEKRLLQSLDEEAFDFTPLLTQVMKRRGYHLSQEVDFPTRIVVDNDAHPVYTLVDIVTPDRLGLLYNLLRAFSELGIEIALSRIATEKGAAIDSFYITDRDGKKIRGADELVTLQQGLWKASQLHAPVLPE